jgi:hypothetical protein
MSGARASAVEMTRAAFEMRDLDELMRGVARLSGSGAHAVAYRIIPLPFSFENAF